LLLAGGAWGQASDQPEAGDQSSEQPGVLGGPKITETQAAPTLVERDYEGGLRALELRPEFAALDRLRLSEAELEPARALVAERGAKMEKLVFENLTLLTQLKTAREAAVPGADPLGGNRELRGQMMEVMGPLLRERPLVDQVAEMLPESARAEYRSLVGAWYDAAMAEAAARTGEGAGVDPPARRRGPGGGLGRGAGRGGMMAVQLQVLGQEIRSAYERGVAGRTEQLDDMVNALELTPEQEGQVRELIRRNFTESDGKPTQAQRAELVAEIFALLTPEQRQKAMQYFRG
jgi:Spy/CpxP family protein refolding chaperone